MGIIIPKEEFLVGSQLGLFKPIIYCYKNEGLYNRAIPINICLAQELMKIKSERRTIQLENCFLSIIEKLPDKSVIRDFDVMFNPEYKIDVLGILVNVCKAKPFDVIWPGKLEENKLIYAEEGYQDYKVFDINNYDITCIK